MDEVDDFGHGRTAVGAPDAGGRTRTRGAGVTGPSLSELEAAVPHEHQNAYLAALRQGYLVLPGDRTRTGDDPTGEPLYEAYAAFCESEGRPLIFAVPCGRFFTVVVQTKTAEGAPGPRVFERVQAGKVHVASRELLEWTAESGRPAGLGSRQ